MAKRKTTICRNFETIEQIMGYIKDHHKFISESKAGGYGLVMLRKPDGRRIIIQEMKFFRMFDYRVDNNILVVYNILTGLAFRGSKLISAASTLYLNDLVQINVFDNSAHFISRGGVDFAYMSEDHSAAMQALQEFIHAVPKIPRASWTNVNADEQDLLDAFSFGKKSKSIKPYRRRIQFDSETL